MMPSFSVIVACEYCDREMPSSQIYRHETVCIGNPDVADAVKACLHECANGPFMPGQNQYERERSIGENIPSADTVMAALGCNWQGVGQWAGLRPQSERMAYTFEAMRQVSAQNHDGRIGPTAREWDTESPPGAYTAKHLLDVYGHWVLVIEAAGLVQESRSYYMRTIRRRSQNGETYAELYIEEARREAARAPELYPRIPGKWKVKTYALWPSGRPVTSLVYELR